MKHLVSPSMKAIVAFTAIAICSITLAQSKKEQATAEFFVCKTNTIEILGAPDENYREVRDCDTASSIVRDTTSGGSIFGMPCDGVRIPKDRMEVAASEYSLTIQRQTPGNKSTITESIVISRKDGTFRGKEKQVSNRYGVLGTKERSGSCQIESENMKF